MLLIQFRIQLKETVCSRLAIVQTYETKLGCWNRTPLSSPYFFIPLQSRPEKDMKDFFKYENQREPFLYRIVVCLERETSQIYNNTGLYQSLYSQTGFTYGFWYGWYHLYGAPNQSCNGVCISKCCSFPRESSDVYQLFCLQWSVSMQSGTHTLKKTQITDSEETWNRCSYMTWNKQWWQHTHSQKRLVIISEKCS